MSPEIQCIRDCAHLHHRWYNGEGGCPREKHTVNKSLVNILTIADCIDAATDNIGRPYGLGKTLEDLIGEFDRDKDVRYSSYISDLFHVEEVKSKINYVINDRRREIYCDIYLYAERKMVRDLTRGPVMRTMLRFAVPMIIGNLLQQCYNIADTMIVGKYLGKNALAAVGSAFTLMTFLTSILLGLCMGSGVVFSIRFGRRDEDGLKESISASFVMIAGLTIFLNIVAFIYIDEIQIWLRVPEEVWESMREYLAVIFCGIAAIFLYNYFSSFLRAIGNSTVPLIFLAVSAVLNIALDFWFVLWLKLGVVGTAEATVISQYVAGIGIMIYTLVQYSRFLSCLKHLRLRWACIREIAGFSILICIQQSVMNFGILMVQGLVNSFGPVIMAAFAAAVKIDAFAYMPVQDFGNAFSTFIAQNYGAKKGDRIRAGLKGAIFTAFIFCTVISTIVWIFAGRLMKLFVNVEDKEVTQIVSEGIRYLHIEGTFYIGIGCLFLLYGLYRALGKPGMSVVLTVVSLGTRVALAYTLSSISYIGVVGIWWSVPIGWFLADMTGLVYYLRKVTNTKLGRKISR